MIKAVLIYAEVLARNTYSPIFEALHNQVLEVISTHQFRIPFRQDTPNHSWQNYRAEQLHPFTFLVNLLEFINRREVSRHGQCRTAEERRFPDIDAQGEFKYVE